MFLMDHLPRRSTGILKRVMQLLSLANGFVFSYYLTVERLTGGVDQTIGDFIEVNLQDEMNR